MQRAGPEDCWRIFVDSIRRKEIVKLEETVSFRDEIVGKCGGLPLAAKALSEVVSYKLGRKWVWTNPNFLKTIWLRVAADAPVLANLVHKISNSKQIEGCDRNIDHQNWSGIRVISGMDPRQVVKELGPFYHTELISVTYYYGVQDGENGARLLQSI